MRLKECNIGWEGHPLSFIKKRETPFSDETSIIFCHKTSSSIYFCDFYPNKRRLHALRMVHYIVCAPPTAIMLQLLPSMMMTMMIIRRKRRTCFFSHYDSFDSRSNMDDGTVTTRMCSPQQELLCYSHSPQQLSLHAYLFCDLSIHLLHLALWLALWNTSYLKTKISTKMIIQTESQV